MITGTARGKKLKTLEGLEVRPTSDMVKEAIFSIIQFDVPGSSVLDLFAGSGQLGIEALSRGASHCVFVDRSRDAVEIVKDNISHCCFTSCSRLLNMDSLEYLRVSKGGFDIALLDPPYRTGILSEALLKLENCLAPGAIVVCEHERELTLDDTVGRLNVRKRYRYGRIALTVYQMPDEDGAE